jgi:diguanylate cyclase (GGDEF)-like protein/PAS domain S-box-containing protein
MDVTALGAATAVLRMLWFVSAAIGIVELLRFLQQRFPRLLDPWPQALLIAAGSTVLMRIAFGYLHLVDPAEVVAVVPFLGMLAGGQVLVTAGIALAVAFPAYAPVLLGTATAALALRRLGAAPLFALALPWLWLAFQTPHHELSVLAANAIVLGAGAVAFSLYVYEVDRRQQALLEAERRSATDPLTGLLSRAGLERWLTHLGEVEATVLMVDLDEFKPVNELYGHQGGDIVLQAVAQRLANSLRPTDKLARVGGDEFVAVLLDTEPSAATAVAERMLAHLADEDVVVFGNHLRMGASLGVATGKLPAALTEADVALLQAKAAGKGRIVVYGEAEPRDLDQERLLRVTSFARELLYPLPLGVVITSRSREIVSASPTFLAQAGLAKEEVAGMKPHPLIGTDITDPAVLSDLVHSLTERGSWAGEFVNRRPNGELWWANWSIGSVAVRQRDLGYLGIVHDATPRHRKHAEMLAEALGALTEQHDPTIGQHLQRTRQYMELLVSAWQTTKGREDLQFNAAEYGLAAMLHDVGKFSVPPAILIKPAALTGEERRAINRHPREGARYLGLLYERWCIGQRDSYVCHFLEISMSLALYHHERFDGSGYPGGVRGTDIPLPARILGVIDVYDALQDLRPYKRPWSEAEAFEYLRAGSGKAFDPAVVHLLSEVRLSSEWDAVRRRAPTAKDASSPDPA